MNSSGDTEALYQIRGPIQFVSEARNVEGAIAPLQARSGTLEWQWLLGQVSRGVMMWDGISLEANWVSRMDFATS